jgi:hypothetical protein
MTGSMRTREVRSRGWMYDSWQLLGFSDGGEKEGVGLQMATAQTVADAY